ncbi:LysM peptidoglycan-binding domain-containing protein [Pseudoroseomonas globiformis]|uniref:LysM peptidoglycan-binding domain-containing protein n=1 Tax=Teichococcus globiformis TaxID=2307229 RepID=A0ABV7G4Y5_9PROT
MMESNRRTWLLGLGLLSLALLGGLVVWGFRATPPTSAPGVRSGAEQALSSVPPPAQPARAAVIGPTVDVARIGAQGAAVLAGRSEPGAEVTLRAGDRELARARADGRGEWVMQPEAPLPPGSHALSLSGRLSPEAAERNGEVLVVVVPERRPAPDGTTASEPPLAVVLPQREATPRLLQGGDGSGASARLGLGMVDYDEAGTLRFSGTAPPGSRVRVYIDDRHAGDAQADVAGRWDLRPEAPVATGQHRLRVDQLGQGGRVAARREWPFHREAQGAGADQLVVQPGNSLWRIARSSYGRGTRYTVIYRANRSQIRDPGRIYPGQILTLPPG